MTDADKLAIIERLAWWMGYTTRRGGNCVYVSRGSVEWVFRPFDKLEDARLLLEECNDRGLLPAVVKELIRTLPPPDYENPELDCEDGMLMGLLATAKQQTLAVWAVVKEQGRDGT